jgi:hypothetical protein
MVESDGPAVPSRVAVIACPDAVEILGYNFLREFTVTVDYPPRVLSLRAAPGFP